MSFAAWERPYVRRMKDIANLDEAQIRALYSTALDWSDHEQNGSIEYQSARRKQTYRLNQYIGYLFRHDFDRVFYGHPYPRPVSDRVDKLFPIAQHLYSEDDPNGYLGPSLQEMVYFVRAAHVLLIQGSHDYDDILEPLFAIDLQYNTQMGIFGDEPTDPSFLAWRESDDYHQMFENREPHPALDYSKMWGPQRDSAYILVFLGQWYTHWKNRGEEAKEKERKR